MRREAAQLPTDDQPGAAAEIEGQLLEPQLGSVRRIVGVQLAAYDRQSAGQQRRVELPGAKAEIEPAGFNLVAGEVEAQADGSGDRHLRLRQRRQNWRQRRQRGRVEPLDREFEVEMLRRRVEAVARVHLRRVAAEIGGERQITVDPILAAFERRGDPVGAPDMPGQAIVDNHRRFADRHLSQEAPRRAVARRAKEAERTAEAGRRLSRIADLKAERAARIAGQQQHRSLDGKAGRLEPAAEQRTKAKAGRHFRKIGELLAIG